MRIGVVTTSYPRSDGDHAGNFVAAHVDALRAAGHDVEVIGAHTIASSLFDGAGAPDELERGGVRAYLAAARFSARLMREVHRRAAAWDLIVAHWLAPSALAAVLATSSSLASLLSATGLAPPPLAGCARSAMPILAIAHGGDIHTLRRLRLLAPTLHALRGRDVKLAFVSADLRDVARAAAPGLSAWLDTAIIQPMGIDVARFRALRANPTPTGRPNILVVSRLVPVKGVDIAVRALSLMTTDAQLTIAGDGPERARLEAIATSSDRPKQIELLGAVDAAPRDRLLASAACVVIPSRVLPNGRSEGTPMIALEALAAGVPVIASAVGGLRELNGITRVPPDDPRALAAAIDRVLASIATDPRHAELARPPIDLAELDWSHVSARLLAHANAASAGALTTASEPSICETGDTSNHRTA